MKHILMTWHVLKIDFRHFNKKIRKSLRSKSSKNSSKNLLESSKHSKCFVFFMEVFRVYINSTRVC